MRKARYQISINGFRVNNETWDEPFSGMGSEMKYF